VKKSLKITKFSFLIFNFYYFFIFSKRKILPSWENLFTWFPGFFFLQFIFNNKKIIPKFVLRTCSCLPLLISFFFLFFFFFFFFSSFFFPPSFFFFFFYFNFFWGGGYVEILPCLNNKNYVNFIFFPHVSSSRQHLFDLHLFKFLIFRIFIYLFIKLNFFGSWIQEKRAYVFNPGEKKQKRKERKKKKKMRKRKEKKEKKKKRKRWEEGGRNKFSKQFLELFFLLKKMVKKKSWKSSEQILPTWQYFSFEKMKK